MESDQLNKIETNLLKIKLFEQSVVDHTDLGGSNGFEHRLHAWLCAVISMVIGLRRGYGADKQAPHYPENVPHRMNLF